MDVTLVAAVARNGTIGRHGTLPWHLPEDLAHFRSLTLGHPVLMGRVTWESIPDPFRPLPGRRNIVVTRTAGWQAEGAEAAPSLAAALELVDGADEVFVIGGAQLYAAAMPVATALELTELAVDVAGDTFFPAREPDEWREVSRRELTSESGIGLAFVRYARR
ncbi:MAG: dihydrofolate reductase [Gaiellales bacterium]